MSSCCHERNGNTTGIYPVKSLARLGTASHRECSYPLILTNIATENDHRNSGFSHEKLWLFHGYLSASKGNKTCYGFKSAHPSCGIQPSELIGHCVIFVQELFSRKRSYVLIAKIHQNISKYQCLLESEVTNSTQRILQGGSPWATQILNRFDFRMFLEAFFY